MTRARIVIDLPVGTRVTELEAELARLARRFGTNLQRSPDPRMPALYLMERRYLPASQVRR